MSRWNEDLRPGEASEGSGYATPDRHSAGPAMRTYPPRLQGGRGLVTTVDWGQGAGPQDRCVRMLELATANSPWQQAVGAARKAEVDITGLPAPVTVEWYDGDEDGWDISAAEIDRAIEIEGPFAAAVTAHVAQVVADREAAAVTARKAEVAAMDLARRIRAEAAQSDAAARRLAQVQAHLVAEADGCPTAHKWLRGDPRGNGYGPGPQATEEEIAEAMAAFGGAVPSDDDGRPACKDAYERALWGFIARLAVMLPDGFPGLPGQVQGADGIPTDPLFRTPALALERAKLGKFKGAWQWSCHYREVVDQFQRMSRRGQGECIQEGYQPIPNTLLERAFRVAALR